MAFLVGGSFNFTAPANTTSVAVRATRYGHGEALADDPNTAEPDAGRWDLYLQDASGSLVGGAFGPEQCKPAPGQPCTIGGPLGTDTGEIRLATTALKWGFLCGADTVQSCYTSNGTTPYAKFLLYGVSVTIDDRTAPAATLAGDLLAAGWRKPTDTLTWSASDNTGIRSGQLFVDGAPVTTANSKCDATRTVPCPNVAATPIAAAGLSDGGHELKLVATDSAGNPATVIKTVNVDGNGPSAVVSRASGKAITLSVTDGASGVAGGTISVRNTPSEPFRGLPTTSANGRLSAKLDRGSAARVGIAVNVTDNAGNVTAGEMSEMSLRVGGRRPRGGAASVSYSRSAGFSGRLMTRDGLPLAGQPIVVEQTSRVAGSPPPSWAR